MPRGGARTGAGRPQGSGKFGEKTIAIRIPTSQADEVLDFVLNRRELPLYQCAVAAGFPSPADSDIDEKIDIYHHLIKHPAATFFVKASGSSMINAGIHDGDVLVVDRSLAPNSGKIVIAVLNGELTVKRLMKEGERLHLVAENPNYPPIDISEDADLRIWGVVTNVVHKV